MRRLFATAALPFAAALAGCSAGPHHGLVSPGASLPEGWTSFATAHYQVLTDSEAEDARTTAERLEAILAMYEQIMPTGRTVPQFPVRVIRRYADYLKYGGEDGTGGCFDQGTGELVLTRFVGYAPGGHQGRMPTEQEIVSTTFHEAWHQYFHWYLDSDQDPPAWFDEGMADYFGQSRPRSVANAESGGPPPLAWRFGRLHPAWLFAIRKAIAADQYVPLREFVKMDRCGYYKDPMLCYPEGWSLVYFLLNTGDARLHEVPSAIVRALRDGADAREAVKEAFAGVDYAAMEEKWKRYVMEMR